MIIHQLKAKITEHFAELSKVDGNQYVFSEDPANTENNPNIDYTWSIMPADASNGIRRTNTTIAVSKRYTISLLEIYNKSDAANVADNTQLKLIALYKNLLKQGWETVTFNNESYRITLMDNIEVAEPLIEIEGSILRSDITIQVEVVTNY